MASKKSVLLIEDDKHLGYVIKDNLEEVGFRVDWDKDGQEGLKRALKFDYDIAILDVMLPRMSGFEIAETLIESKPEMPFLFLTARSILEDKLRGLKLGSDYITKPFEFKELEARLGNILDRKQVTQSSSQRKFTIGNYEFDYVNQLLTIDKTVKKLTKKEADLLRLLCIHINEVMNRDDALKTIWGNDDYFNGRSMDVFISRIRKYLSQDPNIQIINIHGVGFKLAIIA